MLNRNGKHIFVGLCIVFLFFVAITAVASATTAENAKLAEIQNAIVTNSEFNTSDLSFRTFENYDIVKLKGCQLKRNVGEPALPMKSISLVIPLTAKVTDIAVLSSEKIAIEGKYTILPAQPPVPTSTLIYPNETRLVAKKASVYSSSDMYPGDIFRYTGEGNLRGHKIVSLTLFPIQYVPVEKKLIFYTDITLCINYTTAPEMLIRGMKAPSENSGFVAIVKKTVSNPNAVDKFACTYPKRHLLPSQKGYDISANEVKYVIITNEELKGAFQPLADWKTRKGVPAKVVTVSSIEANYSGNDTHEKIRNFIKDASMNWSTEWILLGGDTDVIPCRGAYGNVSSTAASGDYWVDYNIPADLYYSDLDGNWNADGDSIYGEVEDGVDLYPDVFVGRAPVNIITEVQTFVDKTLIYEKNPPVDYELDMLFLAEKLWNDPATWGCDVKNIIDEDCIPPEYDPIMKRYEMYGNISREIAINEMNAGPHIVNHVGHGNTDRFCVGADCVRNSDADGLENSPKNFILYTISCYSNAFDSNSLSEHFINNPDGGTVAYIGNSRYGFFQPGQPGEGPSDLYDKEFFNSLFSDNFYHLGETVADSKVAYIGQSQQDGNGKRWLQYAINLLGDPELPIWTITPQNFTINKPSVIMANVSQEIAIHVLNGTEAVQNATVCIMKSDDDIYNVSATDSSGNVSFLVSPSAGVLNVTVTKHNFIPNESSILVVPSSAPVISSSTHPDEYTWFCSRNATFNWTTPSEPSGIECYSYTLDNLSTTVPDEICNTTENTTSYTDLAYGIWYFHVRAKNNDGYGGPAGHYRVMIKNCDGYDGCYAYDDGCEDRDYYCSGDSCEYAYSNRPTDYYEDWVSYCKGDEVWKHRQFHDFYCEAGNCTDHMSWANDTFVENCSVSDGWVDTGDTRWIEDLGNECKEKEQKEQEYRDYTCSGGSCDYSVTDTQWIDTGNTRNKPDGTICRCTANNTLKGCYNGICSDTGICNSTICGADIACDGKKPGDPCDTNKKCDSNCKCQGPKVIFDTGSPANPYPSISGRHNGSIKPNETITVGKLYTYPCPGTGGHTEYARIWNNSGLDVTARWDGYQGDWHNITFNEPFMLYKNKTYNYTIRTGSYPQVIHAKSKEAIAGAGAVNCTQFVDANGKVYNDWIPAVRLFL